MGWRVGRGVGGVELGCPVAEVENRGRPFFGKNSPRKLQLFDDPQSRQAYLGSHARLPLELRLLALGLAE
jgi:hypothetical protein